MLPDFQSILSGELPAQPGAAAARPGAQEQATGEGIAPRVARTGAAVRLAAGAPQVAMTGAVEAIHPKSVSGPKADPRSDAQAQTSGAPAAPQAKPEFVAAGLVGTCPPALQAVSKQSKGQSQQGPVGTGKAGAEPASDGAGRDEGQAPAQPAPGSLQAPAAEAAARDALVPGAPAGVPGAAPGGKEKIAAAARADAAPGSGESIPPKKTALDNTVQLLTDASKPLGTSVAMPMGAMPTSNLTPPVGAAPLGAQPALGPSASRSQPEGAAAPVSQAVESALQVTDLQVASSQGAQSSVNLRLDVSGEALSVRVALQGGQLHTQFSTNSGELRTALAHEWRAAPEAAGSVRFAEPVFTAGPRGDQRAPADLNGGGGREPGQQRNQAEADAGARPTGAARTPDQGAEGSPVHAAQPAASETASRLLVFA